MGSVLELSASEAARRIRDGELSSVELVQACLDRIEDREPDLQAWAHLDPEHALAQARDRDAAAPRGVLHGVPVGIKDIIDTRDLPTTHGSSAYDGRRPADDAPCVARLREAGAVILGKTVTTELALFTPGPTRNPHDPSRTPGGSSSGSAAAVADGMVPVALGTQTAGSVVRPAAFCGVYGLKPTYGAVDAAGVKLVSPSLDTVGVIARTAADAALVAGLMAADDRAFAVPADELRIGFVRTPEWPAAEASTQRAIESAVEHLSGRGDVRAVELPDPFQGLVEAQVALMGAEAAVTLAPDLERHGDALSQRLRDFLDTGRRWEWARVAAAAHGDRCRRALDEQVWPQVDVLLAPATIGEAPEGLDTTGDPLFCRAWTMLGTPTMAVPGLKGPAGLPLGVQVVAPHGHDGRAAAAAAWIGTALRELGDGGTA